MLEYTLIFVALYICYAIYKSLKARKNGESPAKDDANALPETKNAPAQPAQKNPIPIDASAEKKRKPLDYERYQERLENGNARAVLRSLDAFVPAANDGEAEDVADLVDECFAALAEDLEPQKTIKLYDDLAEKSTAFAAATAAGATDEMRLAFEESLGNIPQKNAKKLALQVARSGHPLVMALPPSSYAMSDFLHLVAAETVDGWELDDLPDLPEAELCARLCALLEGDVTAEQLLAEFAALDEVADTAARDRGLVRVKGSQRGRIYEVDLKNATCTCPDWQERRSGVALDKPDRLCKHLVRLYQERPELVPAALARYAPLFPALDGQGMPSKGRVTQVYYGERNGAPYILMHVTDKAWANVYTDGKRYGYNPAEKRWAYGVAPEDADFWAQELKKFLAS